MGWFNIPFVSIHSEAAVVKKKKKNPPSAPFHTSSAWKKASQVAVFFQVRSSGRGSHMRQTETREERIRTCKETLGHGRMKVCLPCSYAVDAWSFLFPELPTAHFFSNIKDLRALYSIHSMEYTILKRPESLQEDIAVGMEWSIWHHLWCLQSKSFLRSAGFFPQNCLWSI